jgi:hypothetical protein
MVEMSSRLAYRKSESGNPPPTAGAPELYPNRVYGWAREALPEETGSKQIGLTFGAARQSSTLPYKKGESESILAPSLAASIARCQLKRRQGYQWAGRLSSEKRQSGR